MRVVALVKSTPEIEAGATEPDPQMLIEMGQYNEELAKAGVMLAGEGLHPSSKGARVVWKRRRDYGGRRPLHRSQGTGGGVLVVAGEVDG